MPRTTPRPPKIRALEKLQRILTIGWRTGATGCEHLFWREGIAVLRDAYDLGATKPGGLIVELGDKHTILNVSYDDAGPAWDCKDENSRHWVAINRWATGVLNNGVAGKKMNPLAAENFASALGDSEKVSTKSCLILREMATEQWRARPGLKVIVEHLLPDSLSGQEWHARALYLSETLTTDKAGPDMNFKYKDVEFNSKYMLPWLLLVTIKQATTQRIHHLETDLKSLSPTTTAYPNARVLCRQDRTETHYDWRVYAHTENLATLFASPLHVRMVMEEKFGLFNHVRMGPDVLRMHALERAECIKRVYDIFIGHDVAFSPEDAYRVDCQRLAILKNAGGIEKMDRHALQRALRVIGDEWWLEDCPRGHALLTAIHSLYPWESMTKDTPKAALTLLAEMAALETLENLDEILSQTPGLFEAS